ncbi:MAG: holo-ACP synthase [Ethanoligenens sp.]
MIDGIGVDTVELERIRRLLDRHSNLSRIYGEREQALLLQKKHVGSYAAHFCAKEAFAKALGTGVRGFDLCEVELLRDEMGKPYYALSGRARAIVEARRLVLHVSVSHDQTHATAFAVAERRTTE